MTSAPPPPAPPFCPNPKCRYHKIDRHLWRFVRIGFYLRRARPHRIQRYRCVNCRRRFSDQTFHPTYWLRRPDLLEPVFHGLVGCAAFRQMARQYRVSPQTIARHSARLGRHALLFHELHRPGGPLAEPLAMDSFESFEYSQYHPTSYHLAVGQQSHFVYGFTASECRRRGRMTARQKRKRAALEQRLGRPDPRSIEREVATLLAIVAAVPQALELHTDEHVDYPRAIRRLPHLVVRHRTVSSRAARTAQNPLFPVNLVDLLLRHSGSNHKRETIAASKRRASALERLAVFTVWRNWVKAFSERRPDASPAMRLGLTDRRWTVAEVLARRLFPSRIPLPECWAEYYRRTVPTRALPHCTVHALSYAA